MSSQEQSFDVRTEVENPEYVKSLNYAGFEAQTRFLEGDILTIVDASFSDKEQRKAVKDLVKGQFNKRMKHVYELCTGNRMICATGESSQG